MDKLTNRQLLKATMTTQNDQVSRRIKAIRIEKGISQTDLAQKIGVERSNYHRMENRGEKLPYEMLEKIANALGVSVIQLISDNALQEEILNADQLQKRVYELEDRLRDKQQIIDSLEAGTRFVQKRMYEILFSTALDLQLASWQDLEVKDEEGIYRDLFSPDNWGAERLNEKGEAVLLFGSSKVSLTAADLFKIYEHLERTNPDYFSLFTTLEHVSRLPAQSLIRRTLHASFINKLPEEKRTSLFKGGYPPELNDFLR